MKDITIELNTSNASGEAYWRKRCDTVEAEIERIKRNHGCAREQGSTQYCREALDAHKEADRLRAANEELKENVLLLQTEYLRQNQFEDPQDTIDELERKMDSLRAVNAELVRALRSLRPIVEAIHTALATMPTYPELQCLYDEADGLVEAIDAALSRAEQAKPEVKK